MFHCDQMKTKGGIIQKQCKVKKKCYTVILKEYENLVYCNLAAILHIFFISNNIQITARLNENYRSEMKMKSCLNNL